MSRWIESIDGVDKITLDRNDECKHMYNEVCCNEESEHLADFVIHKDDCVNCKYFEKEDLKC